MNIKAIPHPLKLRGENKNADIQYPVTNYEFSIR